MKLIETIRAAWRIDPVPALYAPEPVVLDAAALRARESRRSVVSRLTLIIIILLAGKGAIWWDQAQKATLERHNAEMRLEGFQRASVAADKLEAATERLAAAERRTIRYRILLANRRVPTELLEALPGAIQEAADRFGVQVDTIIRIATIESHFRPSVVSDKGAHGIMGIRELWIDEIAWLESVADLKDPIKNINAGAHIYAKYRRECEGDQDCALAKYNGTRDEPEAFARYKAKFQEVQA